MTSTFASPVDFATYGRYDSAARLAAARARSAGDADAIASLNGFSGRLDDRGTFAPMPDRYHLYLNKGCPFCHRVQIGRSVLGLEATLSASYVDDERDGRGWAFREPSGADPVNGFTLLAQAYEAGIPGYAGHLSVPVLWDRQAGQIVSTDSGDILTDMALHAAALGGNEAVLYPVDLRDDIDALNVEMHAKVNFGVYLVGLAPDQSRYDDAIADLFGMLDQFDARLARAPFLHGDSVTTSDIRLWVTLARFDVGYYTIFRANLRRLTEMPRLWPFAKRLYALDAFCRDVDFARYKRDYVRNFPQLTPTGIIPAGPVADWNL